jgi:hypothetical protein
VIPRESSELQRPMRGCCRRVGLCGGLAVVYREARRLPGDVLKGGEYDVSVEVTRPYALRDMREPPA